MTVKTVLSKLELVRIATFMQLNLNYDRVMIIQKHTNGIGVVTWARFYLASCPDKYQEVEVTDIENW